ncbi:MAG: ATP-binding protein [Deltaproteobacteria bacterium]|nr:ATP-binding protein [Deltaproteobacteria bacterium]MBW1952167.1 ATP-binding protein [Deltaproteobacteria bacterium]MBW1985701.1 ATP-binding protein [Deltaproteobacteria bacterium]MBW2134615.1 ATP-binding protein [Deltaproteobacteria bacterium]
MRELVILSGKGGTGKTSITAALAALGESLVVCDCDVDAADLHLLLAPTINESYQFSGGHKARIDPDRCTQCGQCRELCRFEAITPDFQVDPFSCEGCKVCVHFCPEKAIDFLDTVDGEYYVSDTRFGPMVHARLHIAAENSGKLVTVVRRKAQEIGEAHHKDYILVDGPPGIGCPVIASLTGAHAVLLVTEPTVSGRHDLERAATLTAHFQIPTYALINKWDLNPQITEELTRLCQERNFPVLGRLPYDPVFIKAMVAEKTLPEYTDGFLIEEFKNLWRKLQAALQHTS